jgi:molybdopterin adenylyltransferase
MGSIRVGILTISDRCSSGDADDLSGASLRESFAAEPFGVALYAVIPDDRKQISGTLKRWADEFLCDVILTTGGTGLSPRDFTADATRKVLDRELPGINLLLLTEGLKQTPFAALSQAAAGTRGDVLIVNLPGSPAAVKQAADVLSPLLPHAIDVMRGEDRDHPVVIESAA